MCRTVEGAIECRKKDERFRDCKDIVRDLYKKPPNAPNYSTEQLNDLYESMQHLKVYRHNRESTAEIPPPFMTFDEAFHDYPSILSELKNHSFTTPSPVQSQLWPALLKGNDCIGVSQTGSGKTLAFLLPGFLHIEAQHKQYKEEEKKPCPSVLVLTPTRELAQQIQREVKKYSYNGYKRLVIATPGRLADLADEGVISLATVSYLVLDEADRMLDLGFEPSIRRILYEIRPDRIVALTSATWPESVRKLAKKYTKDAVMVVVGSLNLTACTAVKQYFEFWEEGQKFDRLREIVHFLRCVHGTRFMMIIFVKSKAMVDFISAELCKYGFAAQGIHGGRSQLDRDNVFRELRKGQCQILVATDLVSRGIDIANITHVLNYDFPGDIEEYVHRVGRTGRAGRIGEAMTFISWCDRMHADALISILEESQQLFANLYSDNIHSTVLVDDK
ncbi:DEAD/DEAH box helicase [Ancylostoma ceylanicum]|uniref:RNA helicase n=1 Tax=Ancylostoma ceylanicum TaxID=53326 RepID=A0A0D6LEJ9_9BILA|nr:DEAD/DEAH box helicase [Ancylostoma ceylanicum]